MQKYGDVQRQAHLQLPSQDPSCFFRYPSHLITLINLDPMEI